MIDDDRDRFARLLGTIEAAFRTRFSRETIETYWHGLKGLTWLEVCHAVERGIETCKRVPTVAELRGLTSSGRVDVTRQHRGSYPPDIARRRRALGLPVTAEEHAAYDRGEYAEPRVTSPQKAAILREVLAAHARGEYAPGGPRSGVSTAEIAHWKAHWAAEDARTGRWKHAQPRSGHGWVRLGDTIMDVFREIAARHGATTNREPGEDEEEG